MKEERPRRETTRPVGEVLDQSKPRRSRRIKHSEPGRPWQTKAVRPRRAEQGSENLTDYKTRFRVSPFKVYCTEHREWKAASCWWRNECLCWHIETAEVISISFSRFLKLLKRSNRVCLNVNWTAFSAWRMRVEMLELVGLRLKLWVDRFELAAWTGRFGRLSWSFRLACLSWLFWVSCPSWLFELVV